MSIGFTFTGKVKKPEALISSAKKLAEERYYGFSQWEDGLRVTLCPLGGSLNLSWQKADGLFAQWDVAGDCTTTPAGPGLHQAAVELLDGLDIQKLEVADETDYYRHRNFQRMCNEHFYPWLTTLVDLLDGQLGQGHTNLCLCWDVGSYIPEDVPNTVVTPMGRFSIRWLRDLLARRGIGALAERFFLWCHPGRRDALYDRAVALNLLWEQCWFAPSSRSEEDESVNRAICENLEMAAKLDPDLPLPRRAYAEVCALARRTPALPDGPEMETEYEPGFRKGLVTYSIGSLRLTVPGCYLYEREQWDENRGCDRWCDDSGLSPIWRVNGYRLKNGDAAFTPVLDDDNDLTEFAIKGGAVRCGWRELEEDGQPCYQVRAEVITGSSLFVITVTYLEPEDRADIMALIQKITVSTLAPEEHTVHI